MTAAAALTRLIVAAAQSLAIASSPGHPLMGDDSGQARWHAGHTQEPGRPKGETPVRSPTYEITFRGQAGAATCAEFDDCQVTVGPDTTTLRCELPDQAALAGLIQRIIGLRLEITHVLLVEPAPAP